MAALLDFYIQRCLHFTADILPTLTCLLAAKQLLKTLCIFFIIDSPLKHHVSDGCKSLAKKNECKVKCVLEVMLKRETPNPLLRKLHMCSCAIGQAFCLRFCHCSCGTSVLGTEIIQGVIHFKQSCKKAATCLCCMFSGLMNCCQQDGSALSSPLMSEALPFNFGNPVFSQTC